MKNNRLMQSLIFTALAIFGVLVTTVLSATDPNQSDVRDSQKSNLNTGGQAVFKTQNNRDGTVTLYVVLATPMPTATATATFTPTPTATATPTSTP